MNDYEAKLWLYVEPLMDRLSHESNIVSTI